MTTSVTLEGVTISKVEKNSSNLPNQYSGEVGFRVHSNKIEFSYKHPFTRLATVEEAIQHALVCLADDLGHVANAAKNFRLHL